MRKTKSGFTIVELLIVIVVIAILAAIVIVAYNGVARQARIAVNSAHLGELVKGVELYNVENGVHPAYAQQLSVGKQGDEYLFVGDNYCVSTTDEDGTVYSRTHTDATVVEGECQNTRPDFPVAPESCFAFTAANNEITRYYTHESNNVSNPECPTILTIPETIGGVTVQEIDSTGFSNTAVTMVALNDSMLRVQGSGFDGSELKYLYVPDGVTTFQAAGVRNSALETLYIPSSVSTYGCSAFMNLSNLRSLHVSVDADASTPALALSCAFFPGSSSLQYARFGQNVTVLDSGVLGGATQLRALRIDDGDRALTIGSAVTSTQLEELVLPGRLTMVQYGVFSNTPTLRSLQILEGDQPLTIQHGSFGNTGLERIELPGNTSLLSSAFPNSSALEEVILNEGGTPLTITGGSFSSASSLTNVAFPAQTATIGAGAFGGTGITSVSVPTATTVNENAFPPGTTITRY